MEIVKNRERNTKENTTYKNLQNVANVPERDFYILKACIGKGI